MKIYTNEIQHLADFVRLNEIWISKYFEIENADRKLAENPALIIDVGGFIFTGLIETNVVATCALIRKGDGRFELARMAVDANFQGRGLGRQIAEFALEVARNENAKIVELYSNTVLEPAINLYRSLGFREVQRGPHPDYCRCDIVMEIEINQDSQTDHSLLINQSNQQ